MDLVALELVRKLQILDRKNEYFIFVKPDNDRCLKATSNFHLIELPGCAYPVWEQIILPKAVKKYKIDLLHCTGNTAPLSIRVPFVVTIHDVIYLENIPLINNGGTLYQRFGNLYRRWIVPEIIRRSLAVTTVSTFEKDTIEHLFPDCADKIITIYNGVAEHFKPISDAGENARIKETYRLPDRFIFYQGNTDPKKNTRNVLTAYGKYHQRTKDPLKLVIIDFSLKNLVRLLNSIGYSNLTDDIHVIGYVANSDLPAIYGLSQLFLYPSMRESFGMPLLEAMKCGTPIITANTSAMPEIAGNAAVYVDPLNTTQMADAIENLLSAPLRKDELIINGYERSGLFSWTRTANEMMEMYNRIMQ